MDLITKVLLVCLALAVAAYVYVKNIRRFKFRAPDKPNAMLLEAYNHLVETHSLVENKQFHYPSKFYGYNDWVNATPGKKVFDMGLIGLYKLFRKFHADPMGPAGKTLFAKTKWARRVPNTAQYDMLQHIFDTVRSARFHVDICTMTGMGSTQIAAEGATSERGLTGAAGTPVYRDAIKFGMESLNERLGKEHRETGRKRMVTVRFILGSLTPEWFRVWIPYVAGQARQIAKVVEGEDILEINEFGAAMDALMGELGFPSKDVKNNGKYSDSGPYEYLNFFCAMENFMEGRFSAVADLVHSHMDLLSFNHGKVCMADSYNFVLGGQNMYETDYQRCHMPAHPANPMNYGTPNSQGPVMDVNLRLHGSNHVASQHLNHLFLETITNQIKTSYIPDMFYNSYRAWRGKNYWEGLNAKSLWDDTWLSPNGLLNPGLAKDLLEYHRELDAKHEKQAPYSMHGFCVTKFKHKPSTLQSFGLQDDSNAVISVGKPKEAFLALDSYNKPDPSEEMRLHLMTKATKYIRTSQQAFTFLADGLNEYFEDSIFFMRPHSMAATIMKALMDQVWLKFVPQLRFLDKFFKAMELFSLRGYVPFDRWEPRLWQSLGRAVKNGCKVQLFSGAFLWLFGAHAPNPLSPSLIPTILANYNSYCTKTTSRYLFKRISFYSGIPVKELVERKLVEIRYSSYSQGKDIYDPKRQGKPTWDYEWNHSKVIIWEGLKKDPSAAAFYVGSHNLYWSQLHQMGMVMGGREATDMFIKEEWNPKWNAGSRCNRWDEELQMFTCDIPKGPDMKNISTNSLKINVGGIKRSIGWVINWVSENSDKVMDIVDDVTKWAVGGEDSTGMKEWVASAQEEQTSKKKQIESATEPSEEDTLNPLLKATGMPTIGAVFGKPEGISNMLQDGLKAANKVDLADVTGNLGEILNTGLGSQGQGLVSSLTGGGGGMVASLAGQLAGGSGGGIANIASSLAQNLG